MKSLGAVLAAVVLILPGPVAGQALPVPPDAGGPTGPSPDLYARGPGDLPPPMPGELHVGGPGGPPPLGPPPSRLPGHHLGTWWKDSEVVKRLGLSEAQVRQIEQTFMEHRLRLVDLRTDLEKQELGLQPLLDAERPDETNVSAQIDLITAACGRLEKERALMLLAIRRVLSTDQWKWLQALQQERARGSHLGPPPGPPPGADRRR